MSIISLGYKIEEEGGGFKRLYSQMDDVRGLAGQLTRAFGDARPAMQKIGSAALQINSVIASLDNARSALSALTGDYGSFSTAMRKANTMAGLSGDDFDALRDKVSSMSREVPVARDALASGLYQVVSNGVPRDNWLSFLEASARSSVGGMADLGQAVTVTSTIIKNYGLSWDAAASIQDKIQTTAKNGVTSFEQLAAALPRVTGQAAQLGVSVDELMAGFATLTGVSGNTAEVSTQLAAIFTALIKPSAEASKQAAAMGIAFDASAVRAAGGMRGFLEQLSASVSSFAQQTGQSEQELYARLFGSAESLRALGALTGELSGKFSENIDAMAGSAGTMDAAFAEMSQTGEAHAQSLRNQISAITDLAAEAISPVKPLLDQGAAFGQAALGAYALVKASRAAVVALVSLSGSLAKSRAVSVASALGARIYAQSQALVRSSSLAAAIGVRATTVAVTALYAAATLGASFLLSGLVAALSSLSAGADEASGSLKSVEDSARRSGSELGGYGENVTRVRMALEQHTASLRDIIKGHKDERAEVRALNKEYGDVFGRYNTAAKWMDVLTKKSATYCDQLLAQARAEAAVGKIVENEQDIRAERDKRREMQREGKAGHWEATTTQVNGSMGAMQLNNGGRRWVESAKFKESVAVERGYMAANAELRKVMEASNAESARLSAALGAGVKPSPATGGTPAKVGASAEDTRTELQRIEDQIRRNQEAYLTASDTARAALRAENADLQDKADWLRLLQKEATRPVVVRTVEDVEAQTGAGGELSTSGAVEAELQYQEARWQQASASERESIQRVIDKLKEQQAAMRAAAPEAAAPAPKAAAELGTLSELDAAIDYYREKMQTATASELSGLRETMAGYEQKRDALTGLADLADSGAELGRLQGLAPEKLQVELDLIGESAVEEKIRRLQRLLEDLPKLNLADTGAADEIGRQLSAWKQLAAQMRKAGKEGTKADTSFKGVWGSVKGLGGGIEGLSDALSGEKNAWETLCGVVDNALQIFESVQAIIGALNALTETGTEIEQASAAAKQLSGSASEQEAAKEVTAAATGVAAKAASTSATKADTGAKYTNAIAGAFSAHSWIPFVGVALALGMVAAMMATMSSAKSKKFAKGGVIYGPTLGLMGEYAGAGSNPEVVAPLDRLRSLLRPAGGGQVVGVDMRVRGSDLVAVMANHTRVSSKSGRRTGIQI